MASHAKAIRSIQEEHPFHAMFLLESMQAQASKYCGCNQIRCELCGTPKLFERARRIERHSKIAIGYLTGGNSNKSMR